MSATWEKHVCFTQHSHVKAICQPLNDIGIDHFFYMRIYLDNTFTDLTTDIEWTTYYFTKYFSEQYDHQSVSNHSFIENKISIWSMNPHNQIWIDGFQNFSVKDGISIIVQHKDYRDIFSFYVWEKSTMTTEGLINLVDLLKMFCEYFVEKASKIIASSKRNNLVIPKKYQIHCTAESIESTDCSLNFLNFCNFEDFKKLCNRERTCIQYASEGLCSESIGKKLCISRRTVESYIISARRKTNCKNITELATKYHYFKLMY